MRLHCFITILLLMPLAGVVRGESAIGALATAVPSSVAECDDERLKAVQTAAEALDAWAAALAWQQDAAPADSLRGVLQLIEAKGAVDEQLNAFLELRGGVAPLVEERTSREAARKYFAIASELIDLSGRLRYTQRDCISNALSALARDPERLASLVELVASRDAFVGANVFAPYVSEPQSPFTPRQRRQLIDLMGRSGDAELIPELMQVVRSSELTPDLKLSAIVAIMNIGTPQEWRPGQSKEEPPPAVTPRELAEELARLRFGRTYDPSYARTQQQLLPWLRDMAARGITSGALRANGIDVQPGDWLLIRNPSPYNQVTDLAPGLFTHVGVVTAEKGSDGKTRLVVVEVPERGDRVPATNVDAYLARTLHFFFLRHPDPAVARKMASVAAEVIGNPTHFDLTFRNEHVRALQGKPLKGERIHTYCAGLLHLCAQETESPLAEFFPLIEGPPGGKCLANLEKLGMSIGEDFVSPTGALLSPRLQIVGRREPMYDPGREVKEAVYDHFAWCLINKTLQPSPDAYQALRERLAALSKSNSWLAKALAKANNVSEHMDLESAAKAAAVIEVLDEVADDALFQFNSARQAMGPIDERSLPPELRTKLNEYRRAHAELFERNQAGAITPRELRVALVKHYSEQGMRRIEDRFFGDVRDAADEETQR
jgi:hypothetical protein